MPPSGVSGMMDDEALIEAEIQQQLQQLDNEDDNDPGQWDEVADNPGLQDNREASPHEEVIGIPAEMDVYIRLLNNQTKAFEEELEECDDLINYKHGQNSKSIMAVEDFELLKEAAYEQGQDPEELRRKILDEISRATENMTGADLETEPIVLAGVGDGPGDQGPGIGDEKALVLVDERQLAFQREMKEQIDNAEKQYRIREEKLKAALEEERRKSEILNRETEEQRQQKRQQLEREVTTLAKERLVEQERLEEEEQQTYKQQEAALQQHEENLRRITEEIELQHKTFEDGRRQEEAKRKQKREHAATKIQSMFRGYSVRKENKAFKEILEEKVEIRKKKMEDEKIKVAEQVIQQRREIMEQEEETKRLEMEAKEKEKEEKRRKKEEEERQKEEKKRQKEEEKRIKEEQKRLEKERELEEKRRKKEEEERKKQEEKLRKEEEKKRHEAEEERKKEEEKKRREAEEERKKEEARKLEEQKRHDEEKEKERKRQEALQIEEERKKAEAEKFEIERKQKEDEERKLQEAREQKEEEERRQRKGEEQKIKEQTFGKEKREIGEILKESIELTTPRSSRRDGRISSRSCKHDQLSQSTDQEKERKRDQKAMMLGLPDRAEVRRLQWIKSCIPWSKVSNEPWKLKTSTTKKPSRRPSSAKKLEPIDKYIITSAAQVDTLRQVTTVQLQDLPGCDLSTLGQCWGLKYLSMTNCNLVAVDGLHSCKQLQLVHFKHNYIEYVDLKDLGNLTYVNISHNKLSVIHGLEGCGNLRWLDLSYNRLTRIGGMYSLRRLHTVNLSHNQLISTAGLGDTPTIQNLDLSHNHLQDCQDTSRLCLLQVLKLSSNNLLQLPDLKNQVLLQTLCVEDNSLANIKGLGLCWFPLLQKLDLSQNSIEHLVNCEVFHLLRDVDVGSNQIIDHEVLTKCLCDCMYVEKLGVIDNPALEEDPDLRSKLAEMFPRLLSLDSAEYVGSHDNVSPIRPRNSFEAMCVIQAKVFQDATNKLDQDLMSLESDGSVDLAYMCEIHFKFCDKMYQVAVEYRNSHEYGEVTMTMPTAPSTPKTVSHPRSGRARPVPAIREDQYISPKEMFERALQGGNSSVNNSQGGGMSTGREPKITADMVGKFLERDRDSDTYRLQREKSAILIQAAWRGYCVRKRLLAEGLQVKQQMSDIDYEVLQELHRAATKIQAVFRGYNLRNKLEKAIEFARLDDSEEEDFGEVDLGDFNFDENMLDDWKPPETPQIPASHAVLGKPPSGKLPPSDHIPYLDLGDKPHPPGQPRKAWRGMDSPLSDLQTSQRHPRPPSSLASGTITGMDSHRSVLSKKEEKITQEWGFKDNQTAILMMQRAKKMKYNAERRKKLGKLDPKQRLALFRKLEETTNIRTVVQPSRKTLPRKEYFQARQQEIERKDLDKRVENHNRTKRTFEWIHTQVGDYEVSDSRINPTQPHNESLRKIYGSEGNLPKMTAEVTSGRPVRLMSPGLDIQSVDSVSNHGDPVRNPRRFSAGSDASSTRLPPIKTGSAPSVRGKEKMSWRRKEVNKSIGWGGGKKRSHVN